MTVLHQGAARPRSSADRAPASGAGGAGSSPAGGAGRSLNSSAISDDLSWQNFVWQSTMAITRTRWTFRASSSGHAQTHAEARELVLATSCIRRAGQQRTQAIRIQDVPWDEEEFGIALAAFVTEVAKDRSTSSAAEPITVTQTLEKWSPACTGTTIARSSRLTGLNDLPSAPGRWTHHPPPRYVV